MKIKRLSENSNINAAKEIMLANEELQDVPSVGSFWYDPHKEELFGVASALHIDVPYYQSSQFNTNVRTGRKLHKNIWDKEQHRGKDSRFKKDYTRVPRGRVFEFENDGFKVLTGEWINKYPGAKELIISEFQLPRDNTEFLMDSHWDIGHGWSDDFI